MLYPTVHEMSDRGDTYRDAVGSLCSRCETNEEFAYLSSRPCYEYDELGRINDVINMNCCDILSKFVTSGHRYVMPNEKFDNLPAVNKEEENNGN